jgi:type II secretory pathway component GspD/PulD (secretin)
MICNKKTQTNKTAAKGETMNLKTHQAIKRIVYTLLIVLGSVLVTGAQTNSTAPAPSADSANAARAALLAALAADTNAPAAATNAPAATATNSTDTNAVTVPSSSTASTNAPSLSASGNVGTNSASVSPDNTAATNTPSVSASGTTDTNNAAAMTAAAPAETTATPVPAAPVGIPLITFSDVPIRTAIEHLARRANINYMLDPKIGYGEPDANGQIKVEPTLSIRWENITAENALLSLLDNYGLQMVLNKQTGIHRITLKDPSAPPPLFTKVVQLKYASVSNMLEAAQSVLSDRRSKVLTDPRTSQLIVVATDPEQVSVDTLVKQLDKPTRQVLIETRLIELSSNPRTQKGVDWTQTLQAQQVSFGNGKAFGNFNTTIPGPATTDPAGQPIPGAAYNTMGTLTTLTGNGGYNWNTKSGSTPDIGFLNADGLNVVLSFLNSSKDAQVMSTPRVVTLDNETATISVFRTFPIFTTTAGTANTAGGSSISYSNVGTMLHVTPRISANDYIWLKVMPEVSSFFGNFQQVVPNTGTTGGSSVVTAPQFDIRAVTTQVLIPNSNTLVMGGLVQDNPSQSNTKVPLLGDIPGIGQFFRSEDKQMSKDNLLIFITPTIVKDTDFHASNSGDFLKTKPQVMKDPMNPKSAWDGTNPEGKWSDPITQDVK